MSRIVRDDAVSATGAAIDAAGPEPRRVTHIITSLGMGGAERMLHTLLTGGLQDTIENTVISLTDGGHYGPLLRRAGISVTCLDMRAGLGALTLPARLQRVLREDRPDIIQGWMYHGNFVATLGRRLASGKPAIAWNIRTSLDDPAQIRRSTRLVANVCRSMSPRIDRIVYNSSRSREQHREIGYSDARSTVIPNGFDLANWRSEDTARAAARRQLDLPYDVPVVGFVGRASPVKDIPTLLSAFRSVLIRHPEAVLVLVGRGMESLNVNDIPAGNIRMMGQRPDVAKLLPGFDVFCLSSLVEGFPNVVGEAMACKVPCVATDVGDTKKIVGTTGWVVAPGDPVAYGTALDEALSMAPEERACRGVLARKRIADNYSLEGVVASYSQMYETIGGRR